MRDPVEAYVSELRDIHTSRAAVSETSYYPALAKLFDAAGAHVKPKVRCVMQLRNIGAGMPDGGLFTPNQFKKGSDAELLDPFPSVAAIEVKGTAEDITRLAGSEQVARYVERYGLVLVTNLRDFALVGRGEDGTPRTLEAVQLAANEAMFWAAAEHPRTFAEERGEALTEFLWRAFMYRAPLTAPKDVARYLASYARTARLRLGQKPLAALDQFRATLEEALGLKFEGDRGDHFFRSTLVQTLFYGVFSAWVLWSRQHERSDASVRFNWHEAAWSLHVPMIRSLFEQVAAPSKLGPLKIAEVLDWTEAVLNRVDRVEFFARFEEEHAVQYFYEPFLEAFDPQLRKDLGVWYTPPEIVKYMVARVDTVLREELDIPNGLADPSVYVLDPCCGTGAYLVEVLRRIDATLTEQGADGLTRNEVKEAALNRIFGFEIMPAPFVIAHLQLGLLLQELDVPLDPDSEERVGVFLTNALTGWEPPKGPKQHLLLSEFEEERDAAAHVKRDVPILVILGNPPYNGFAGMAVAEERGLSDAYRTTKRAPKPQGQGLNDLYVRFFRMAERRIVEQSGKGVVCFISNYSWLDGLSFTGMRERYLEVFDKIWIDNLNGDKYKTGKTTPDGKPDPSIFSTEHNREGIQVGIAISLLVRSAEAHGRPVTRYRDLWGVGKWAELADEALQSADACYSEIEPIAEIGYPISSGAVGTDYLCWPKLPDLFPVSFPGVQSKRDSVVVDIDRDRLLDRMRAFCNPNIDDATMKSICPDSMRSTAQYDHATVRGQMKKRGLLEDFLVPYVYRPFDVRWIYWEPDYSLLSRRSPDYFPHVLPGNVWLEARRKQPMEAFDRGYVTSVLSDNLGNGFSSYFPLRLRQGPAQSLFADEHDGWNLSERVREYLGDAAAAAATLFRHLVAMLNTPAYRVENASALRQDWPRIPLPGDRDDLLASAELGREVAALLDVEDHDVAGVAKPPYRPELKLLGRLERVGGGNLDPNAGDLAVTAGWGHGGKGGVTMPAKGRYVERGWEPDELAAVESGTAALGMSVEEARGLLCETVFDVYLNDVAHWRGVPANVWCYTIGGYQVIKKWLSYRERPLLGRDLKPDEARYVSEMVRRIAALVLLQPRLDENYRRVKERTWEWKSEG